MAQLPFGTSKLQEFEIHIPPTSPRGRHPEDSNATVAFPTVWETSSADHHMHLAAQRWVDPEATEPVESRENIGRSTQWGSQLDLPHHFDAKGRNISNVSDVDLLTGDAIVIDLRAYLGCEDDNLAITAEGVRRWAAEVLSDQPLSHFEGWDKVLVKTLEPQVSASDEGLKEFPYFENPEAVNALLDAIHDATGRVVKAIFVEPPSVDRVDQGHLLEPDPESGDGGAHGALYKRGVAIGENFCFARYDGQTIGRMIGFTDNTMEGSPDSVAIAGAYFVPQTHIAIARSAMFGDL